MTSSSSDYVTLSIPPLSCFLKWSKSGVFVFAFVSFFVVWVYLPIRWCFEVKDESETIEFGINIDEVKVENIEDVLNEDSNGTIHTSHDKV